MLPKHRCLELIANSEQDISALASRRLLTYEKITNYTEDDRQTFEDFSSFREK